MSKHHLTPESIDWLAETFARNRARFGGWSMEATGEASGDAGDDGSQERPQTFTQADVDRIVKERVQRERTKYADYDDLKTRAEGAKTLEDRVAEIERQAKDSEARALRAEVANAKGLTPSQAKRLVGSTREELEADADELVTDIGAQKKRNNVSPREGTNPQGGGTDPLREYTRNLFARSAADD